MPLTRPCFDVWLNLPDRELTTDTPPDFTAVTIMSGDQLRAELEASRLMMPPLRDAPLNATALWLWAALVRLHHIDIPAGEFMANVPEWQPAATGKDVTVDPTKAAGGQTGSDSLPPSETPGSGLTLT